MLLQSCLLDDHVCTSAKIEVTICFFTRSLFFAKFQKRWNVFPTSRTAILIFHRRPNIGHCLDGCSMTAWWFRWCRSRWQIEGIVFVYLISWKRKILLNRACYNAEKVFKYDSIKKNRNRHTNSCVYMWVAQSLYFFIHPNQSVFFM